MFHVNVELWNPSAGSLLFSGMVDRLDDGAVVWFPSRRKFSMLTNGGCEDEADGTDMWDFVEASQRTLCSCTRYAAHTSTHLHTPAHTCTRYAATPAHTCTRYTAHTSTHLQPGRPGPRNRIALICLHAV